jgi:hypothetical protein
MQLSAHDVRVLQAQFTTTTSERGVRTSQQMVEVGRFRFCSQAGLYFSFLVCVYAGVFCVSLAAQEAGEKQQSKEAREKNAGSELVKISGSIRCEKPMPSYSIEVPDRPGHSLMIEQRKCAWTEPWVILGAKAKDGVRVTFVERMDGALHPQGYETDTLEDGDTITMKTMSQVLAEDAPTPTKGRFSFTKGTGKYKGIKGGGSYEGKMDADGALTLELEGLYSPADMAGGLKSGGVK